MRPKRLYKPQKLDLQKLWREVLHVEPPGVILTKDGVSLNNLNKRQPRGAGRKNKPAS